MNCILSKYPIKEKNNMLKKTVLGIIVATSMLGTTLTFADEKKEDQQIIELSNKQKLEKINESLSDQTAKEKYEKGLTQTVTSIQEANLLQSGKMNAKSHSIANDEKAFIVSLTTFTLRTTNQDDSVMNNFIKINNDLVKSNNLGQSVQPFGKLLSTETYTQNLVTHKPSLASFTKSIEYVNQVSNGVQSTEMLDLTTLQAYYLNSNSLSKKLLLSIKLEDSVLISMDKEPVNDGPSKSYVELPRVATYTLSQDVSLKNNEYKLIDLREVSNETKTQLSTEPAGKVYKGIAVKLSEQEI
jgi:hypothetical protein